MVVRVGAAGCLAATQTRPLEAPAVTGLPVTCVRCQRFVPRRGVSWPEGFICNRCYQQATRRHGHCASCQTQRLLPGLSPTGEAICVDCAAIPKDFHCTRCSQEDEPHRKGQCARCCLREDLSVLLDDGTGQVHAQLTPLFEALCTQERPRSAMIWLRNPDVAGILTAFANGSAPLRHETIDAMDSRRSATHLGEMLVKHGVLSQRNRVVVGFQGWLDRKLPGYSPETARLLTAFATWHHLRRMRAAADADRLVAGAAASVKLQISVAGQLLTHLENQNIGFTQVSQADVDAWLVAGPSTRYLARNFVIWAVKARHLPAVTIPHRTPRTSPILRQDERLSLLRRVLHGEDLPLELRVAATLLLLYAQPVTRICRLRVEDIVITGEATGIRFGNDPAPLPSPVADLILRYVRARPNMATAANADSPWLFPGYRPGQPLNASYLMHRLRTIGIHLRGARNAALRQLVLDIPPAVAAQALGYSPQVAENHARPAGTNWVAYASH